MEIVLNRIAKKDSYTIGRLYIDGKYVCDTCEDKDRGLTDSMTVEEIKTKKVYGQTAIPTGTYTVSYTMSNRFKKMMPLINNVKGFEGIRMHNGTTAADSLGCVLLGQNKAVGKVLNSRATCAKVYPLIEAASKKGERITITIK